MERKIRQVFFQSLMLQNVLKRVGDFKSKNPDFIENQDFTLFCFNFL